MKHFCQRETKGCCSTVNRILILNGKISITFQTPIFENKTNKLQKNIRQVTLPVTSYFGSAQLNIRYLNSAVSSLSSLNLVEAVSVTMPLMPLKICLLAFIIQITGVVWLYSYAEETPQHIQAKGNRRAVSSDPGLYSCRLSSTCARKPKCPKHCST